MPQFDPNILSNLNGTNGFTITGLVTSGAAADCSLATGDFNNDGTADIVVGRASKNSNAGGAYVIFGSTSYSASFPVSSLNGTNGFIIDGININDRLGSAVCLLDVNGDHIKDLVVSARQASGSTGLVYVIFGTSSPFSATFDLASLNGSNGFQITGNTAERMGNALSGGDINGDGTEDIIVGASAATTYVIYGSTDPFPAVMSVVSLNGTNGFKINTQGVVVYGADIDNDDKADFFIRNLAATNYLIFGDTSFPANFDISSLNGTNGFSTTNLVHVTGLNNLITASDINDDGHLDMIFGEQFNGSPGKIYTVFGKPHPFPAVINLTTLNGTNGFTITGIANTDYVGGALSTGDINGDLIPDFISGTYPLNSTRGGVSIVYGSHLPFPTSFSLINATSLCRGMNINGITSQGVGINTVISDVNNDGYDDIIATSNNNAYVVYGFPSSPALDLGMTTNVTYTEGDPALVLVSNLTLNGGNCDYFSSATMTITNVQTNDTLAMPSQPNIIATFDSGTGVLSLSGNAPVSEYQTALRSVTFNNPSQSINDTPRQITFAGSNGNALITPVNLTINVVPVNDVPVLTGSGTALDYTSNQALIIDNSINLSDADHANMAGATVSVSSGFVNGDVLSFTDQNGIIGQYNSNTGVLTLTGSASVANYQAALRSITYQNANSVTVSNREISFVVNDGIDDSIAITRTINLVPLNNLLSGIDDGLICFNHNESEKFIVPQVSIIGGNALTLEGATVTVSDPVSAEDVLEFTDLSDGITGNYDSNTGVLTLTGPATASDFEAALRTVKYKNSNDTTSSSDKTFTVEVNYAGLSSNTLQSQIDLITVNDAPVVINPVEDFNVTVSEPFSTVLSNNTFNQPVNELTLSVTENDGALTSLDFDPATRTLNGSLATVGENRFSFFVSDRCNQTAASNFTVNAVTATSASPTATPIAAPISSPITAPITDFNIAPSSQDNTGPIAGGVVGGIAGLVILGGAIFGGLWAWRKKQAKKPIDSATKPAVVNTDKVDNNAEEMVETSGAHESDTHSKSSASPSTSDAHSEASAKSSASSHESEDNSDEESAENSASSSASRYTP